MPNLNANIIVPWVLVVVLLWLYTHQSQQTKTEESLQDLLRELSTIRKALKQGGGAAAGGEDLQSKRTESTSIILPSLNPDSTDLTSFGLQLQKEGKHNGYFSTAPTADAEALLTKWTMYQKVWLSQRECNGNLCDLISKDTESRFDLSMTVDRIPDDSVDFLYFQLDDPKTKSNALGPLRTLMSKCRVGSIIMLVAPNKDAGFEHIARQLGREVCSYAFRTK
eukprot:TRINITY_DN19478_c0_g1_i1.p1 TRINITY_DN19478_c0_g1~~TRINITY_DN19478_c0_g1_i1.p1  ORF type:complete len:251 (+),score=37.24 TRINITY_DN19478_c0_g1_i1:85-753(+)